MDSFTVERFRAEVADLVGQMRASSGPGGISELANQVLARIHALGNATLSSITMSVVEDRVVHELSLEAKADAWLGLGEHGIFLPKGSASVVLTQTNNVDRLLERYLTVLSRLTGGVLDSGILEAIKPEHLVHAPPAKAPIPLPRLRSVPTNRDKP